MTQTLAQTLAGLSGPKDKMAPNGRPEFVDAALFADETGLRYGRYHDFVLRTAYQPAFRIENGELAPAAFEGLISAVLNGIKVPPSRLFAETPAQDRLFVDGLCRALHLHNAHLLEMDSADLWIRLDMEACPSEAVWIREIRVMARKMSEFGLAVCRVICQLDGCASVPAELIGAIAGELRRHGFRIAIDDFGDADVTLDRVSLVKPEFIRVDGSLFRDLCRVRQAKALIRPLVAGFRASGVAVVIEGIETAAQFEIALDSGADLLQGFALAAPQLAGSLFDTAPRPVEEISGSVSTVMPMIALRA